VNSRDRLRALVVQVLSSGVIERKTLEQYLRQLRQYSRDYYNGKTDDGQFLDSMIGSISNQINRAWNEGMRTNGLDPQTDKDEAMLDRINELVRNEQDHITNLADLINQQREAGADMTAINARVDVWANRYTDVVNIAKVETGEDNQRFIWIYGDTTHCSECEKLNGVVLTSREWREGKYHPQQPPNDSLTCGGWKCRCRLEKTKKKRTGLPSGL
jgi:hypothetical protein